MPGGTFGLMVVDPFRRVVGSNQSRQIYKNTIELYSFSKL